MIGSVLLALGLVFVIEGLVYALAPFLVENLLEQMRVLPIETRRRLGLLAVACGVFLVWIARLIGA